MTADFPATDRCPKCGAAVRFGDPWCTLCYTDLRPPPPPAATEPVAEPSAYDPAPFALAADPLTAPLAPAGTPVTGPTWPCAACGTVNPMAHDTCTACGQHFLAAIRDAEAPLLQLPVIGDIARLHRGQRFALAFGIILVVVVITVLLGFL